MNEISNYISNNELMGIPMDIVVHFIIGLIVLYIFRKSYRIVPIIFFIAFGKEVFDFYYYGPSMSEHLKDIAVIMLPLGISRWI